MLAKFLENRRRFPLVPTCLPVTVGVWGGTDGDENTTLYSAQSWIYCNLPSYRIRRLYALQCAMRAIDESTDGIVLKAFAATMDFADIDDPTPSDCDEIERQKTALCNWRDANLVGMVRVRTADAVTGAMWSDPAKAVIQATSKTVDAFLYKEDAYDMEYYERHDQSRLLSLFVPLQDWDNRWITDTTSGLARTIYEDWEFDLLPKLSDALQDAGCDHPWLNTFLQDPKAEANGCRGWWFLDRLRGYPC